TTASATRRGISSSRARGGRGVARGFAASAASTVAIVGVVDFASAGFAGFVAGFDAGREDAGFFALALAFVAGLLVPAAPFVGAFFAGFFGVLLSAKRRSVVFDQARIWPSPNPTHFRVQSSARPIGPYACSFVVEIPISAPSPSWNPSLNRVEALC